MNKKPHMWTKKEVKKVASIWETTDTAELAKDLGVDVKQLKYIVAQMRLVGFVLSKKRRAAERQAMLRDVLAEMK